MMCSGEQSFPDFDELDEDLIRIFSNYNRDARVVQNPAVRANPAEVYPSVSVLATTPPVVPPLFQSFPEAMSMGRSDLAASWQSPRPGEKRPLQTQPLKADAMEQGSCRPSKSQQPRHTGIFPKTVESGVINVDEIMAYSPYAAKPQSLQEVGVAAASDMERKSLFPEGLIEHEMPSGRPSGEGECFDLSQDGRKRCKRFSGRSSRGAKSAGLSQDDGHPLDGDNSDDEYTRKKKDAVTSRGRKAGRLQLSERHYFEDSSEAGHTRSKHHKPWTTEETVALVWAVEKVGGGKWAEIKKMKYKEADPLERRSAVDLKDKWRNLQNAIDRPASEKKKELSPELAERIRRMRSACNTKARGDNRKGSARRVHTLMSLSPHTQPPEPLPVDPLPSLSSGSLQAISSSPATRGIYGPRETISAPQSPHTQPPEPLLADPLPSLSSGSLPAISSSPAPQGFYAPRETVSAPNLEPEEGETNANNDSS